MNESRQSPADGQRQQAVFTTTRHHYTLKNGKQAEVYIQSFDPREPSSAAANRTASTCISQDWILGINGTVFIKPGDNDVLRPTAGKLTGLLIKRELIPQVENEFLRRMMSLNSFTQQQAQQLFNSHGRLRHKFKETGTCEANDNGTSWIFELCTMDIAPNYRRDGLGRILVECVRNEVLTWAREAHRDVLMVLMLGAPKSEMDEYKLAHPASSAAELQVVLSTARRTAKRFWRSLGFRRLSPRSNWFGWRSHPLGPGAAGDQMFQSDGEWESEDEVIKFESHDDDMAPDVAEKLALYAHHLDP